MGSTEQLDGYDYIVIGAGSAGCSFCARLVELLPDVHIALIESGKDYMGGGKDVEVYRERFANPAYFISTWTTPVDRGYRTIPQPQLNNRKLPVFRANGIGGCSLMNAMLWFRGFKQDWDENMPNTFKGDVIEKEFNWLEEKLKILETKSNSLSELVVKGAMQLGFNLSKDSPWLSPGVSDKMRKTIDENGQRQDIYRALGANHDRITLISGVAETLLLNKENRSASGIVLRMFDGTTKEVLVKAKGEVILCCGAIDTPKLLQLSGIGPKDLLDDLGIPTICNLSHVGKGLKEHPFFTIMYGCSEHQISLNPIFGSLYDTNLDVQYLFMDGSGVAKSLEFFIMEPIMQRSAATSRVGSFKDTITWFLCKITIFINNKLMAWFPSFLKVMQSTLGIAICLMKPKSVGTIAISSKDPKKAPVIDYNMLGEKDDMNNLIKGIKNARKLVQTEPLKGIVKTELIKSGENEEENVKEQLGVYFHPTGSCSIGNCLDDHLRVKGISQLRVADASSLPFHPRVPTAPAAMAIGARCASLIAETKE